MLLEQGINFVLEMLDKTGCIVLLADSDCGEAICVGDILEGNDYIPIRFGVKEFNNEQYELYIVVGSNKIKTEVLEMTVWDETSDPNNSHPVSTISIPRIIENVNPQDISLLKYLPSPLLNSEQ